MQIQKISHVDKGKFGTGKGLLWYGICARCKKQASVVRDAFSGALGAQNRLLWYGRDIRYRKRTPMVRGVSSERRTGKGLFLSGVCCIRCGQCSPFSGSLKNSVPERAFSGTEYARGAKNRLLWYATHFQGHSVRRTGFCGTEGIFGTGNALLWYGVYLQSAVQERASSFLAFVVFGAGNALLFLAV